MYIAAYIYRTCIKDYRLLLWLNILSVFVKARVCQGIRESSLMVMHVKYITDPSVEFRPEFYDFFFIVEMLTKSRNHHDIQKSVQFFLKIV